MANDDHGYRPISARPRPPLRMHHVLTPAGQERRSNNEIPGAKPGGSGSAPPSGRTNQGSSTP